MSEMSIGVVGLGAQGVSIVRRLARAGLDVAAADPDPRTLQAYVAGGGASPAASPAQMARACTHLVLSTEPQSLEYVIRGPNGIAGQLQPGTIVLDMSGAERGLSASLAGRLEPRGVAWVEIFRDVLPDSSSILFVSGPTHAIAQSGEIFAALGDRTVNAGRSGGASLLHALVATEAALRLVGLSELMLVARGAGVEPFALAEALEAVGADPHGTARCLASESIVGIETLAALVQEIDRIINSAALSNVPTHLTASLRQIAASAARTPDATGNSSDLVRGLQYMAGRKIAPDRT